MDQTGKISITDYDYDLPDERIAKFPLEKRDASKLLFYKNGVAKEKKFREIADLIPENALMVFNETKVIRARLIFQKPTGAKIEIFCLEPVEPSADFQLAFQQPSPVVWKCLVGNAKRWKQEELSSEVIYNGKSVQLNAKKIRLADDSWLIEFRWNPGNISFLEIIELAGKVPLPPYLHREAVPSDSVRYQTVYARYDGSVAAPTAGLHFTENTLQHLKKKGVEQEKVTLHVGAGTFRPVVSETIGEHEMHPEKIVISKQAIDHLLDKMNDLIIAVGTTSMRTLESLFWIGLKLSNGDESMFVNQWDPYKLKIPENFSAQMALRTIKGYLISKNLAELHAETKLMIAPGYQFKIAKSLITNFHQPKSTLLLLVSALIGDDWKKAYKFALEHDFRFLSYGDSCLFLP